MGKSTDEKKKNICVQVPQEPCLPCHKRGRWQARGEESSSVPPPCALTQSWRSSQVFMWQVSYEAIAIFMVAQLLRAKEKKASMYPHVQARFYCVRQEQHLSSAIRIKGPGSGLSCMGKRSRSPRLPVSTNGSRTQRRTCPERGSHVVTNISGALA